MCDVIEAPLVAGAAEGEMAFSVDFRGHTSIAVDGTAVVKMKFVFWDKAWKYASARTTRAEFKEGQAAISGRVRRLGISLDGVIDNKTPNQLAYRLKLTAGRELDGIIGGGVEFRLTPPTALAGTTASEPELLPGKRGWKWLVSEGREIRVVFSKPLVSLYFERGKKDKIRAMFVGKRMARGTESIEMTIFLPKGGHRVSSPSEKYGTADVTNWHREVLVWNRSPVDLSFLNHKPAGKHGFVKAQGERLLFEDGSRALFWGGNLAAHALFQPKAEIEEQARRIAQLGFNLMRIHHHDSTRWVSPTVIDKRKNDSRQLDRAGLAAIDYWIKCLKEQGVYVWLDLHVGRQLKLGDEVTRHGTVRTFREIARKNGELKGFCYYDETVQALMKEFQARYLSHVNPYTKLAYKNDPAVMGVMITNENDLTNHFGNLALSDKGNPLLNELFNTRLKAFCSRSGLSIRKTAETWQPGESKIFLNQMEHLFNRNMLNDLRKAGLRVPICTTSTWGGNPLFSLPALTEGDIIDVHKYEKSEFLSRNPRHESNLASWIGAAQVAGMPLSISEWNVVDRTRPAVDRFTAPLYVASVGCLQGWDAPMIYNYSQRDFRRPRRQETWSTFADPGIMAVMPAAAIAFREGHVAPARKSYCLKLNRRQLYFEKLRPDNCRAIRTLVETSRLTIGLPNIPELDWDRETNPASGATIVTNVEEDFIPPGQNFVESDTGELRRDWRAGIQTINTSRTQAAQGWIGNRTISLKDVRIRVKTAKAVVAVTAIDGRPIRSSRKILLTTVARVVAVEGKMPFYSEPVTGSISIRAKAGLEAVVLNGNGTHGKVLQAEYTNGRYNITLDGRHQTHWYLLLEKETEHTSRKERPLR